MLPQDLRELDICVQLDQYGMVVKKLPETEKKPFVQTINFLGAIHIEQCQNYLEGDHRNYDSILRATSSVQMSHSS